MTLAVYAGSFDPVTNGHLWIINESAKLFDKVIVTVGTNPLKAGRYKYSLEQRMKLLEESIGSIETVIVDSMDSAFLIHYADSIGATHIVRGIRSSTDLDEELALERGSKELAPHSTIEWYRMHSPASLETVSSSFVKGLIGYDNWEAEVKKFVPLPVAYTLWEDGILPQFRALFPNQDVDSFFGELVDRYSTPLRAYHNLTHIAQGLSELQHIELEHAPDVALAWFGHDAIYHVKPVTPSNEAQSAAYMNDLALRIGLGSKRAKRISDLILATEHTTTELSLDEQVITDVDLSILGTPPSAFDAYERKVRREYNHVPDPEFAAGRSKILIRFLERPSIYQTEHFRQKYEAQARSNLTRSLEKLSRFLET